jgi:hypothetical protein
LNTTALAVYQKHWGYGYDSRNNFADYSDFDIGGGFAGVAA